MHARRRGVTLRRSGPRKTVRVAGESSAFTAPALPTWLTHESVSLSEMKGTRETHPFTLRVCACPRVRVGRRPAAQCSKRRPGSTCIRTIARLWPWAQRRQRRGRVSGCPARPLARVATFRIVPRTIPTSLLGVGESMFASSWQIRAGRRPRRRLHRPSCSATRAEASECAGAHTRTHTAAGICAGGRYRVCPCRVCLYKMPALTLCNIIPTSPHVQPTTRLCSSLLVLSSRPHDPAP